MSEYKILTDDASRKLRENCDSRAIPPAEIELRGVSLPKCFLAYYRRILDLEVREDDIWLVTFPKVGTTWTQEMVWLLCNNCDFDTAKSVQQWERFPFLDFSAIAPNLPIDTVELVDKMPRTTPRLIKAHAPESLLPTQLWTKKPKIIYVYRNPKDVAISYFYHIRLWNNYTGSLSDYLEAFCQDKAVFSPFWGHVLPFWRRRHDENILFNRFEDMKADLEGVIKKTASFLDKSITPDQMSQLLEHLSIDNMRNNPMVNQEEAVRSVKTTQNLNDGGCHIRKGAVGEWKEKMSQEMVEKFDAWTESWLRGTDFTL